MLAYYCLEILDSILEFADPENLDFSLLPRFLAQNGNECNFGLLLPKFG